MLSGKNQTNNGVTVVRTTSDVVFICARVPKHSHYVFAQDTITKNNLYFVIRIHDVQIHRHYGVMILSYT